MAYFRKWNRQKTKTFGAWQYISLWWYNYLVNVDKDVKVCAASPFLSPLPTQSDVSICVSMHSLAASMSHIQWQLCLERAVKLLRSVWHEGVDADGLMLHTGTVIVMSWYIHPYYGHRSSSTLLVSLGLSTMHI